MDGGAQSRAGLPAYAAAGAELGNLKRTRDARSPDSLAARGFRRAWTRLAGGEDPQSIASSETADALAATRLGAIDRAVLADIGVADPAVILHRGFDDACTLLPLSVRETLRPWIGLQHRTGVAPAFVQALIRQPRAGATCPGKPRLILEPPENHGEHCFVVSALAVVLSGIYGADPALVFVAGLAHHLHNAILPDSGFAGECLLGDQLTPVMGELSSRALQTLSEAPANFIRSALACIPDAASPEGRAFHAADVLDRVLQVQHYEDVAGFTARHALATMELVHAGPLQAFHKSVLAQAGLA